MGRKYTLNPARPVTFSLTSEHLEVIHDRIHQSRFKNRSEWLQNIIDEGSKMSELPTAQILAYLMNNRPEILDHLSQPILVKMIQELNS